MHTARREVDFDAVAEWSQSLKLTHAVECQAELVEERSCEELSPVKFLDRVLEREIKRKDERRIATSLRLSRLPVGKTPEGLDFWTFRTKSRKREQISQYHCPHCGDPLSTRTDTPLDPTERYGHVFETYECGLQTFGGTVQCPCPSDLRFPSLSDYDLFYERMSDQPDYDWRCDAQAKTEMAKTIPLDSGYVRSRDDARSKVQTTYIYRVGRMTNED